MMELNFISNTYNNTISNVTFFNNINAIFHSALAMSIGSPNTVITNVTAYNNDEGISFYGSNTTFKNNNASNNTFFNMGIGGLNDIIDTSNIIDYNFKLYYNYSISNYVYNTTTAPNAATVICSNCNNVTIRDLNLSHHNVGAVLSNSSNSIIRNITASTDSAGIYITGQDSNYNQNNSIVNVTVSNNGNGIQFYFASNISVTNVSAINNGFGLYLDYSANDTLIGTNMSGNNYSDFYILDTVPANHIIDSSNTIDFNSKLYYNYSISNYVYNPITAPMQGLLFASLQQHHP